MMKDAGATVETLLKILKHSLPPTEEIKIIDANHNDNSVIFNWRNNGYILSGYKCSQGRESKDRVAVGKICAGRFSDDNSHILLELMINRNLAELQAV